MHSRKPSAVLASFVLLVSLGAAAAPEPPRRLKLAVIVSVDGLPWTRLERYRPWYVAGLKRLLDEGLVERAARYAHLNTETGPGHAALGTGAPPRVTGIVANRWFQEDAGSMRFFYCTDQAPPGAPKDSREVIPGPANLRVPTLGDDLVKARPGSRVVAVSGKDRGAIFLAGHDPSHVVYWYDHATGRFVTSAAYDTRSEPGSVGAKIVTKFDDSKAGGMVPGRFGLTWRKLPAQPPKSDRPLPAPAVGIENFQVPVNGLGFDHDMSKHPQGYWEGIYTSPFLDELTMDLVLAFLEDSGFELGHRDEPDLLCLSLSSHDVVSHNYGNESEENLDTLRRLDVQLGRLLDALERNYPKGTVVLALSSDHGFTPIPEVAKKSDRTFTGGRLVFGRDSMNPFLDRLNRRMDEILCLDDSARPLFATEGWSVFYDRPKLPMKTVEGPCGAAGRSVGAREIDGVLPRAVAELFREEVSEVLLISQRASWKKDDPAVPFAENDLDLERSGDAILVPRPNVLMHWDPGRGSGHGSHHETDIHVPLVFWGGGLSAGVSNEPVTPYDLAPTLGKLLGVPVPDAVGHALVTDK